MRFPASLSLLVLVLQEARQASLPEERKRREERPQGAGDSNAALLPGDYALSLDNYDEVIDLGSYQELTDYGDQAPEVRCTAPWLHPLKATGSQGPGPSSALHAGVSSSHLFL